MINERSNINFNKVSFNPFEDSKEIEKIVTINEPQREIWLSCMIGGDPASLAYNESISLDLKGDFKLDYFRKALEKVVQRHEALRSTVSPNGENLIIYRSFPFILNTLDLSAENAERQKSLLQEFLTQDMSTTFDLQNGPLFRTYIHKLSETHHYFTFVVHHIVGDGWSLGVILKDLSKVYNDYVHGRLPLLEKGSQISTYAEEQAEFLKTEEFADTEAFWLNMYKNSVPVLDLPTDYPRPSRRSYQSDRIDQSLPVALIDQLKKTGAQSGCSFVNTLLAAFEVYLYQLTKQEDLVVGLPSSGQSATGNPDLVGHCVNLLPLRSHVDPDTSFNTFLKTRKTAFLDAYDHQLFSFGQLIKKLNIKRDHSRIPLVPVVFNIDMGMDAEVAFDGLTFSLVSNPRTHETFEIFLNATGSTESFTLEWTYNTQLFKPCTIGRLTREFEALLQSLVQHPDEKLKRHFQNRDEEVQHIELPNSRFTDDKNLLELFNQTVNQYPDKAAVAFGAEELSYTELNKKANQLASYLINQGILPGDYIGLAVNRSLEMLISLLAILKAGAVYIPLDPEYPKERIEFMLDDSAASLLLVSKKCAGKYETTVKQLIIEEVWPLLTQQESNSPTVSISATDLAYILYTSGSTGKPKGVKINHHNLANFLLSMQEKPGINSTDKLLAITTISFDIAGLELYLPLISGATLVIADADSAKDGRLLLSTMEDKNITIMQATPSTWQMILDSGWQKAYNIKVLSGGEPLSKELADQLLKRSLELWNMYGPTETTIWSTLKKISSTEGILSVGSPIRQTQVYIMDEEGKKVSRGATGEIYIGGSGVAEGYLNRDELTAEKFVKDTYSSVPTDRLYKTGDLGRILENGEIQCLGRIDQQVKIRGHRIELGEIESTITLQPEIKQAVVVARDDSSSSGKRLVAYVLLKDTPIQDNSANLIPLPKEQINQWRENLDQILPAYMMPDEFIALKSFPLTPNAKIDKNALPKPSTVKVRENTPELLPRTKKEKLIAGIWSNILEVDNLKVNDDFFELGGHSLLAVKIMVAIEKETGKRLPLSTLFENSTIEKLAAQLSADESDDTLESVVPIKPEGSKPPLFLIHGGGLNVFLFKPISEFFDKEQPVYGMQGLGLTKKKTEIPKTMEEIAAIYAKEILIVSPEGPYSLAGYSFGGFLAFEIARQLHDMGKEVKLVGLLDTYAGPEDRSDSNFKKVVRKIKRQFYKAPFFFKKFIDYPIESIAYQFTVIKSKLNKDFLPEDLIPEDIMNSEEERKIYDQYNAAHMRYHLAPLDLKVTLFRAKKRLYFLDDRVYLGWDRYALKGVEIHEIPGDHRTFLRPPNDKKFAEIMQAVLDHKE